jgi:hypothetical protein
MMEVPYCRALLGIAKAALARTYRKVPVKAIIVSIDGGKVLSKEWLGSSRQGFRRQSSSCGLSGFAGHNNQVYGEPPNYSVPSRGRRTPAIP